MSPQIVAPNASIDVESVGSADDATASYGTLPVRSQKGSGSRRKWIANTVKALAVLAVTCGLIAAGLSGAASRTTEEVSSPVEVLDESIGDRQACSVTFNGGHGRIHTWKGGSNLGKWCECGTRHVWASGYSLQIWHTKWSNDIWAQNLAARTVAKSVQKWGWVHNGCHNKYWELKWRSCGKGCTRTYWAHTGWHWASCNKHYWVTEWDTYYDVWFPARDIACTKVWDYRSCLHWWSGNCHVTGATQGQWRSWATNDWTRYNCGGSAYCHHEGWHHNSRSESRKWCSTQNHWNAHCTSTTTMNNKWCDCLNGYSGRVWARCNEHQSWSHQSGSCNRIRCPRLSNSWISNSHGDPVPYNYAGNWLNWSTSGQQWNRFTVTCRTGYEVNDWRNHPFRRTSYTVECHNSGGWTQSPSGARCVPARCNNSLNGLKAVDRNVVTDSGCHGTQHHNTHCGAHGRGPACSSHWMRRGDRGLKCWLGNWAMTNGAAHTYCKRRKCVNSHAITVVMQSGSNTGANGCANNQCSPAAVANTNACKNTNTGSTCWATSSGANCKHGFSLQTHTKQVCSIQGGEHGEGGHWTTRVACEEKIVTAQDVRPSASTQYAETLPNLFSHSHKGVTSLPTQDWKCAHGYEFKPGTILANIKYCRATRYTNGYSKNDCIVKGHAGCPSHFTLDNNDSQCTRLCPKGSSASSCKKIGHVRTKLARQTWNFNSAAWGPRPQCRQINRCTYSTPKHECAEGSVCEDWAPSRLSGLPGDHYQCNCASHQKGIHCKERHNDCAGCQDMGGKAITGGTKIQLVRTRYYRQLPNQLCPPNEDIKSAAECWTAQDSLDRTQTNMFKYSVGKKQTTRSTSYPRYCSVQMRNGMSDQYVENKKRVKVFYNSRNHGGKPRMNEPYEFRAICKAVLAADKHLKAQTKQCDTARDWSHCHNLCERDARCFGVTFNTKTKQCCGYSKVTRWGGASSTRKSAQCRVSSKITDICGKGGICVDLSFRRVSNGSGSRTFTCMCNEGFKKAGGTACQFPVPCPYPSRGKNGMPGKNGWQQKTSNEGCPCDAGYSGRIKSIPSGWEWKAQGGLQGCRPKNCRLPTILKGYTTQYARSKTSVANWSGSGCGDNRSVPDARTCTLRPKAGYWCVDPGKCGFGYGDWQGEAVNIPTYKYVKSKFPAYGYCKQYQCRPITKATDKNHMNTHHIRANCAGGSVTDNDTTRHPICEFKCDAGYTISNGNGSLMTAVSSHVQRDGSVTWSISQAWKDRATIRCSPFDYPAKTSEYNTPVKPYSCTTSNQNTCNRRCQSTFGSSYKKYRKDLGMHGKTGGCVKNLCDNPTATLCENARNEAQCRSQCTRLRTATSTYLRETYLRKGDRRMTWGQDLYLPVEGARANSVCSYSEKSYERCRNSCAAHKRANRSKPCEHFSYNAKSKACCRYFEKDSRFKNVGLPKCTQKFCPRFHVSMYAAGNRARPATFDRACPRTGATAKKSCTFECLPGWAFAGKTHGQKSNPVKCTIEGKWEKIPACIQRVCQTPQRSTAISGKGWMKKYQSRADFYKKSTFQWAQGVEALRGPRRTCGGSRSYAGTIPESRCPPGEIFNSAGRTTMSAQTARNRRRASHCAGRKAPYYTDPAFPPTCEYTCRPGFRFTSRANKGTTRMRNGEEIGTITRKSDKSAISKCTFAGHWPAQPPCDEKICKKLTVTADKWGQGRKVEEFQETLCTKEYRVHGQRRIGPVWENCHLAKFAATGGEGKECKLNVANPVTGSDPKCAKTVRRTFPRWKTKAHTAEKCNGGRASQQPSCAFQCRKGFDELRFYLAPPSEECPAGDEIANNKECAAAYWSLTNMFRYQAKGLKYYGGIGTKRFYGQGTVPTVSKRDLPRKCSIEFQNGADGRVDRNKDSSPVWNTATRVDQNSMKNWGSYAMPQYRSICKTKKDVEPRMYCNLATDGEWTGPGEAESPSAFFPKTYPQVYGKFMCQEKTCPAFEELADGDQQCPGGHHCRVGCDCPRTGVTSGKSCSCKCPVNYVLEDTQFKDLDCKLVNGVPKWSTHRASCYLENAVRFPLDWLPQWKTGGNQPFQQQMLNSNGKAMQYDFSKWGVVTWKDEDGATLTRQLIPAQDPLLCPDFPCGKFRGGKEGTMYYVSYTKQKLSLVADSTKLDIARAKKAEAKKEFDDAQAALFALNNDKPTDNVSLEQQQNAKIAAYVKSAVAKANAKAKAAVLSGSPVATTELAREADLTAVDQVKGGMKGYVKKRTEAENDALKALNIKALSQKDDLAKARLNDKAKREHCEDKKEKLKEDLLSATARYQFTWPSTEEDADAFVQALDGKIGTDEDLNLAVGYCPKVAGLEADLSRARVNTYKVQQDVARGAAPAKDLTLALENVGKVNKALDVAEAADEKKKTTGWEDSKKIVQALGAEVQALALKLIDARIKGEKKPYMDTCKDLHAKRVELYTAEAKQRAFGGACEDEVAALINAGEARAKVQALKEMQAFADGNTETEELAEKITEATEGLENALEGVGQVREMSAGKLKELGNENVEAFKDSLVAGKAAVDPSHPVRALANDDVATLIQKLVANQQKMCETMKGDENCVPALEDAKAQLNEASATKTWSAFKAGVLKNAASQAELAESKAAAAGAKAAYDLAKKGQNDVISKLEKAYQKARTASGSQERIMGKQGFTFPNTKTTKKALPNSKAYFKAFEATETAAAALAIAKGTNPDEVAAAKLSNVATRKAWWAAVELKVAENQHAKATTPELEKAKGLLEETKAAMVENSAALNKLTSDLRTWTRKVGPAKQAVMDFEAEMAEVNNKYTEPRAKQEKRRMDPILKKLKDARDKAVGQVKLLTAEKADAEKKVDELAAEKIKRISAVSKAQAGVAAKLYGKQIDAKIAADAAKAQANKAKSAVEKKNADATAKIEAEIQRIQKLMADAKTMFKAPAGRMEPLHKAVLDTREKIDEETLKLNWGPAGVSTKVNEIKNEVNLRNAARNAESKLLEAKRDMLDQKLKMGAAAAGRFAKLALDHANYVAQSQSAAADAAVGRDTAATGATQERRKALFDALKKKHKGMKATDYAAKAAVGILAKEAQADYLDAMGKPYAAALTREAAAKIRVVEADRALKACIAAKAKCSASDKAVLTKALEIAKALLLEAKKDTAANKNTKTVDVNAGAKARQQAMKTHKGDVGKAIKAAGVQALANQLNNDWLAANAAAKGFQGTVNDRLADLNAKKKALNEAAAQQKKKAEDKEKSAEKSIAEFEALKQAAEAREVDMALRKIAAVENKEVLAAKQQLAVASKDVTMRVFKEKRAMQTAKDDLAMAQKDLHIARDIPPKASAAKIAALKNKVNGLRGASDKAREAYEAAVKAATQARARDMLAANRALEAAKDVAFKKLKSEIDTCEGVKKAQTKLTQMQSKTPAPSAEDLKEQELEVQIARMTATLVHLATPKPGKKAILEKVEGHLTGRKMALKKALDNKADVAHVRVQKIREQRAALALKKFEVLTSYANMLAKEKAQALLNKVVKEKEAALEKATEAFGNLQGATYEGLNGPTKGTNPLFYKLNKATGYSTFKAGWSFSDGFFALGGKRMSSLKNTGTLTTPTFVITKNTVVFKTGYGSPAIDAMTGLPSEAERSCITMYRDYGLDTQIILRQHCPDGSKRLESITWDTSGIMEEAVTIVVTDVEATSQLYFDSLEMYDGQSQCLPECLEIETDVRCPMSGGKPKKNCLRLFGDKKGVYEPVQAETDGSKLYCLTSASKTATGGFSVGSPGTAGGSPIKFGKWSGIKEYNTYGQQAPGCITMRKTSPTDYIISAGDNRMKFFFSSKRKPASADAEKNLVCIYPTQTPRCADVFGALRNMDTYEVACDESNGGESACTDAAYDGTCRGMKMEGACGEAKTTLDILKCCDKNGNKAGSGCTNSRRRLAAAAPKRHPANPTWVYEKDAEPCAKKCRTLGEGAPGEKGKCVAWRLEKTLTGETHCILSTKCYPGKHPVAKDKQLEVKKWYAFKGSNPFSATPPKKVRKPKRKL